MAAVAIDPTFSKAFRLLFSDEPDSAEQMRAMLDEALKQKYGTHKTLTSVLPKKLIIEEGGSNQPPSPSSVENVEEVESEESNNSPDHELSELNILEEDLLCIVCRQMNQSDGNRLVECQECHGLYHQECHQPPINETEIPINDPRLAWYCSACKKKLNKAISVIKSHKPVVAVSTSAITSSTSSSSITPATKTSVLSGKPPFMSYKSRVPKTSAASKSEPKQSTAGSSSGNGSSKSSKPSSSSKGPIQNINMITADKRLQMIKKKAAAANKIQDKKK